MPRVSHVLTRTHLTDLGQRELDTPDLALASETVLAAKLELRVEAFLLIRPPGGLEGLPVCKPATRSTPVMSREQQAIRRGGGEE